MLHTKFQPTEPNGSEEEDFLIFVCVFSNVQTQDPLSRAISVPWGHHLEKNVVLPQGNTTYEISSI